MTHQVYLKADDNVYKFGITCDPDQRHKAHRRTNPGIVHYASFYVKDRQTAYQAEDILKELTAGIRAYGNEWCVLDHDTMTNAWNQVFEMFQGESDEVYADWEWEDGHSPEFEWMGDDEFLTLCMSDAA